MFLERATTTCMHTTGRHAASPFTYRIPYLSGTYTVKLGFAEPTTSAVAGQRLIDVSVEGASWLTAYDVVAASGAVRTAVMAQTTLAVSDGELTIQVSRNAASDAGRGAVLHRGSACGGPALRRSRLSRRMPGDVGSRRHSVWSRRAPPAVVPVAEKRGEHFRGDLGLVHDAGHGDRGQRRAVQRGGE